MTYDTIKRDLKTSGIDEYLKLTEDSRCMRTCNPFYTNKNSL
jgi:hypothetical protein